MTGKNTGKYREKSIFKYIGAMLSFGSLQGKSMSRSSDLVSDFMLVKLFKLF